MKLTAELSLYPLRDDYLPAIEAFIEAARRHSDMLVVTNAMSTQVCGDYDAVFALLSTLKLMTLFCITLFFSTIDPTNRS